MAFRKAGVTHFLGLYFAANSADELVDQMQMFAEEVMPRISDPASPVSLDLNLQAGFMDKRGVR